MMHRKHRSLPLHFFCHRCRLAFKVAPRWCRSRNSSPKSLLVVVVATERSPHFLPNLVRNSNTLCIFFDMRWCYFENYAISKAHYFFKLGREKNIFVKFVFLCVLSKVEKFATKDRLLINQSHHHTIPPIGNLINPFSNHHTIIILKSHNLRNICIP